MATSFSGGGSRSTQREPLTMGGRQATGKHNNKSINQPFIISSLGGLAGNYLPLLVV
jgi:hypothetical protein